MSSPSPSPCVNCGSSLVAEFCAGCGQRTPRPEDYSLRELRKAVTDWLTNYDHRLFATVRTLFLRPGQLARDHFEGRRARHLDPLRIFLLANLAAWLIVPHSFMRGFKVENARRWAQIAGVWERGMSLRASIAGVSIE